MKQSRRDKKVEKIFKLLKREMGSKEDANFIIKYIDDLAAAGEELPPVVKEQVEVLRIFVNKK
jgi:hypothetical protein